MCINIDILYKTMSNMIVKGKTTKSRKLKKDRQHNRQKKTGKRTNNDLRYITQKTKDRVTLIH